MMLATQLPPVYVLAAGKGTRMHIAKPKCLVEVGEKPILFHTLDNLIRAGFEDITVVVGHLAEQVTEAVASVYPQVKFYRQQILQGTGRAVFEIVTRETAKNILVMNGDDSFLYNSRDILDLVARHAEKQSLASLFLVQDEVDRGYRKVLLDDRGDFAAFTKQPAAEGYTVTGLYLLNTRFVYTYLSGAVEDPFSHELRLTDFMYIPEYFESINCKVISNECWFGVNTQEELTQAKSLWKNLA